ncbi:MAG TPA: NAD(P)-binding domain-containing protein, partial [Hyphomonadaceae bacterium]|nr:NAD(P)-binding domain-containing protein [Hyphomonadaceae bacterium]
MSAAGPTSAGGSLLKTAVLIGAGRMGSAMARGWLSDLGAAGLKKLIVVEPSPGEDVIEAERQKLITLNSKPSPTEIVVLAIKPQGFSAAAEGLKAWVGPDTLIVSIMAGISIARISSALGSARVARAMPNTPGAIGMGATGFALSDACSHADSRAASNLLEPLGLVIGPLPESQMDVVT